MALTGKKYSSVHSKTGGDKDLLKDKYDEGHISTITDFGEEYPHLVALVYQIQEMQDELDYLRTEISANKDKTTFPGFGSKNSQALAGDTTTISTAQANAITANTAKTTFPGFGTTSGTALEGDTTLLQLGTSSTTALRGDTNIVTIGSSTTIAFGDMITVTHPKTGKITGYNIVMTVTNGGVSKSITLTLT